MKLKAIINLATVFLLWGCSGANLIMPTPVLQDTAPIAFEGAEGYGKYATGGRGGTIIIVDNLNDKGPGSFREAVGTKGKRIVVFEVSGTIHLNSKINLRGDLTIAGQSAPGDGICLADAPVSISGDNIIIRYLRFRMGDKNQKGGMVDGNGADDALGGTRRKHIIIDHCSLSWSTDEVFSVYAGDSTTLQWNMIYEPLNYSYHFEAGDKEYEHHGYGGIWGGQHLSGHHNLFAHCNNRNPRFDGIRNSAVENVDLRNNVIYNWGNNSMYAGEGGSYNIVNNYYKYGPNTTPKVRNRIVNPGRWENPVIPYGKFYVAGNYVDEFPDVTANNWSGVVMGNKGSDEDKKASLVTTAFPFEPIPLQSAKEAYTQVLAKAGASLHRDTLDERIVQNVRNRTGHFIDVQGGFPHGTAYEETVDAWPTLSTAPSRPDGDRDGIPDDWELQNGLNANDKNDAVQVKRGSHYTYLESYINSLTTTR